MSTIPKEIQEKAITEARRLHDIRTKYDKMTNPAYYDGAREGFITGYQLATDGREELEKEIADLKLEIQLSDDSIAEHKNTITALQSQCTEKEKECEKLKADVEHYEKEIEALKSNLYSKED